MNLLNKLTIKNLKLNRKRTIVTIIGIILSVALITAVSTMYSSMIKSLIEFEVYEEGNFHAAFYNVPVTELTTIKNTREVEEVYITSNIGYARLKDSKNEYKPYAFIKGMNKSSLENLSVKLIEGKLPENENEILIPTHLKYNGRVVLNVGDTITLDIGTRKNTETGVELNQSNPYDIDLEEFIPQTNKTYKIVGIIERPAINIEEYSAPGYTFITYINDKNIVGNVDVYAKYTKKGSSEYTKLTARILGIDEELFTLAYDKDFMKLPTDKIIEIQKEQAKAKYSYNINTYLITLENNPLRDSSMKSLGAIVLVVIAIIIATSVFCIKNSFDISITEKIKQYGMLRSIGATKKQIRRNVFYEGTILGIIGIPLGILSGFIASYILIIISNILLKDMFSVSGFKIILAYSIEAIIISIILGIVTIYASALKSAIHASRVSPIDSIRNSANIKIKSKKIKSPKLIKKLFKIGGEISYKNMKRNKKKYRTTIISISVSVAIFVALSYFIITAFSVIEQELNIYDYNISLHKNKGTESFIESSMNTTTLDLVKDYAIYRSQNVRLMQPKHNKEFIKLLKLDEEYENAESMYYTIISIGDYQYRKYLNKLGLDFESNKDKAILIDYMTIYTDNDKKKTLTRLDYQKGDTLKLYKEETEKSVTLDVIPTNIRPFGLEEDRCVMIVSDEVFDKLKTEFYEVDIYYETTDADKLQDEIEKILQSEEYSVNNIDENYRIMRNLYILVAIFLYGFIIVISLIGITNIFNTITTNMSLRKQEFAMLKSIGMTSNEFTNMIRLESIFIGFKALITGIPIGIGLSYLMYKLLEMDDENYKFTPPLLAILLSIVAVYALITMLMKYSMNKINKENTIETIRNENI